MAARARGEKGRSGHRTHRQYRRPHASLDPFPSHDAAKTMSPRCNLKKKIPTKKKKATEFRAAHQKCSSSSNARARAPDGREAAGRTPEQEQPRGRQGQVHFFSGGMRHESGIPGRPERERAAPQTEQPRGMREGSGHGQDTGGEEQQAGQ